MANSDTWRRAPLLWLLFSFRGRASRAVYWWSVVAIFCVNAALFFQLGRLNENSPGLLSFVMLILSLAAFLANIAIAVKRLHDFGKDGRYALILLLPVVAVFALLSTGSLTFVRMASLITLAATVWFGIPASSPGPNSYGEAANVVPQ